ncbi:hypothetical protein L0M91_21525, partial [Odoribacter splanchnicus]|uniref:RHS repeat-associated core domain-containing protein n=1 Tax=Odoribacter splanchnicus TaxID=28118 RepID=UPI001EDCFC7B
DYAQSTNRWKYNGKELQTTGDLGYLDYGARMYDTGLGRWFSVDPAGGIRTFAVVISFWIEQSPDVYRLLWIVGIFISERQLVYE